MAVLNCIPSFISMRDNEWIFGAFYCRLNSFTSCFTVRTAAVQSSSHCQRALLSLLLSKVEWSPICRIFVM